MIAEFSIDGLPGILAIPGLAVALLILNLVVILLLAVAVKNDAEMREARGAGLFLVGPWFWFFIVVLTGGYPATLAYWLIHYSSMRGPSDETVEPVIQQKFRPPAGTRE
ncbi:MAG: hypothetical protein ABIO94_06705 [Opitutaceae bacterium]